MPGQRHDNPCMMTSGGLVNLYDPDPECWDPRHVAETLSHEHRYVGNYGPYSVAQHAVLVARVVGTLINKEPVWANSRVWHHKRRLMLAGLHHDDAEVVTGDIPSPVKREIKADSTNFKTICDRLERSIERRYGLERGDLDHDIVKEADLIVFLAEVRVLTPTDRWAWYANDVEHGVNYMKAYQPEFKDIAPWEQRRAFAEYMGLHTVLTEAV